MSTDRLQYYKAQLLKKIILILGIVVFVLGIMRLFDANYTQFTADMLLTSALFYGFVKLQSDQKSFTYIARFTLFFGILTVFTLVILVHNSPMRFIWFATVVYLIFYLFDKKEGWIWVKVIATILIALFLYDKSILGVDTKEFLIWVFNMAIILMIVNWYEKVKEESTARLLKAQYMLADQVKAKTLELQNLNNTLQSRIEEEVEKNRYQEQMILQQTRMAQMGEMINMIAHQWRQPLSAISATTNAMILKNTPARYKEEYFDERLHKVAGYAQHLSATIDDFKNFFKTNKRRESSNLQQIVEDSLNIVHISLINQDIRVVTDFKCEGNFPLYANELRQVVLNLLKNAEDVLLEKQVENPTITITTSIEASHAVLTVMDNGGGIKAEDMQKIFKPYFTTKNENDGTGLGLYMSKIIVEDHCSGQLSVVNTDDGALFKIVLKVKE